MVQIFQSTLIVFSLVVTDKFLNYKGSIVLNLMNKLNASYILYFNK